MSIIFSFFRKLSNVFSGFQNTENCEPTDIEAPVCGKRRNDENLPEIIIPKRRKLDPISFNDPGGSFSLLNDPARMSNQRRLRNTRANNGQAFRCLDLSSPSNNGVRNANLYSLDGADVDNTSDLASCTVLLQRTEIGRNSELNLPRKMSFVNTRQGSLQGNKSYSSHVCHRSPSCLDRISQEQSKEIFAEMVKKCSGTATFGRKTLPLTTSAVHNTKQNQVTPNKGYNLRNHSSLSTPNLNKKKIIRMKDTVADRTVIDLTNDEDDDESQRKIIETNVRNSMQMKNFKSTFVGKDTPVVSPDYIDKLLKKYDLRQRNINSQLQSVKKTIQREREEFNKSLVEILEKRLVIKEHVVEDKPTRDLAPVTPSMVEEMKRILGAGNSILIQIKDTAIKVQDVGTLRDCGWLNDEVINAYMNLIKIRSESDQEKYPKVHCFNTFFYPQLLNRGYSSVRRWTKKIDVFDYTIVIVPIHLGNHWCLAEIRMQEKVIKYYDSFGSPNTRCLETMLTYLTNEYEDKKGGKLNASEWRVINVPRDEIPIQQNVYDCGVFACTYAEHITRNAPFNFLQKDMSYFREKMKYEILTGQLLL